ncbi:MAG: hypothetical protein IKV55_00105, partial [Oscillospiraceae bacterium]|nr:hypothetical protein [Oscillospiraceae bacterium]
MHKVDISAVFFYGSILSFSENKKASSAEEAHIPALCGTPHRKMPRAPIAQAAACISIHKKTGHLPYGGALLYAF